MAGRSAFSIVEDSASQLGRIPESGQPMEAGTAASGAKCCLRWQQGRPSWLVAQREFLYLLSARPRECFGWWIGRGDEMCAPLATGVR